jgi:hypothetical protein
MHAIDSHIKFTFLVTWFAVMSLVSVIRSQDRQGEDYAVDPELGFATGPDMNEKVPEFTLPDQYGHPRSLAELLGKQGAILNFYRSASW